MSVTHNAVIRNAIAVAVQNALDAGTGAGSIEFLTSGDVEVATMVPADPMGTVTDEVLTFNTIETDASATGGTVSKFDISSQDGTGHVFGSVTLSGGGGDIIISDTVITAGFTVTITALTYTAPP